MASRAALAEVVAPDGRLYLIGSGGFVRRQAGGPFSIVVYPVGPAELAVLRSEPTYVEPIRRADAFYRRLEELTDGIRRGTWTPPALSDSERARLENQVARRVAKWDAKLAWARQHPFAAVAEGTAKLAVVMLVFVAIGVVLDLVAGDEVSFPSPVPCSLFSHSGLLFRSSCTLWRAHGIGDRNSAECRSRAVIRVVFGVAYPEISLRRLRDIAAVSVPDVPVLRDNLVELRQWSMDDVAVLVQACDDEELRRWLPGLPRPYSPDDARAYVDLVSDGWRSGAQFVFAVIDRETGQPVGSTRVGPSAGGATAGYWTASWARGMGVASRALRLVSTWASGLGLSPIRLYIDPGNLASQRVALAAGFVTDEDDRIMDDEGEPGDRVFILQASK